MFEREDKAALDRKQRDEQQQTQDGKTVTLPPDRDMNEDFAARPLPKRSSPAG